MKETSGVVLLIEIIIGHNYNENTILWDSNFGGLGAINISVPPGYALVHLWVNKSCLPFRASLHHIIYLPHLWSLLIKWVRKWYIWSLEVLWTMVGASICMLYMPISAGDKDMRGYNREREERDRSNLYIQIRSFTWNQGLVQPSYLYARNNIFCIAKTPPQSQRCFRLRLCLNSSNFWLGNALVKLMTGKWQRQK
jgi:hypothetical protein